VGFHGYYGIHNLYRLPVRHIYLIGGSLQTVEGFFHSELDARLWSSPRIESSAASRVACETHRLRIQQALPADLHGYSD